MIQTGEVAGVPYRDLMEAFGALDVADQFEILSEMYARASREAGELFRHEYYLKVEES